MFEELRKKAKEDFLSKMRATSRISNNVSVRKDPKDEEYLTSTSKDFKAEAETLRKIFTMGKETVGKVKSVFKGGDKMDMSKVSYKKWIFDKKEGWVEKDMGTISAYDPNAGFEDLSSKEQWAVTWDKLTEPRSFFDTPEFFPEWIKSPVQATEDALLGDVEARRVIERKEREGEDVGILHYIAAEGLFPFIAEPDFVAYNDSYKQQRERGVSSEEASEAATLEVAARGTSSWHPAYKRYEEYKENEMTEAQKSGVGWSRLKHGIGTSFDVTGLVPISAIGRGVGRGIGLTIRNVNEIGSQAVRFISKKIAGTSSVKKTSKILIEELNISKKVVEENSYFLSQMEDVDEIFDVVTSLGAKQSFMGVDDSLRPLANEALNASSKANFLKKTFFSVKSKKDIKKSFSEHYGEMTSENLGRFYDDVFNQELYSSRAMEIARKTEVKTKAEIPSATKAEVPRISATEGVPVMRGSKFGNPFVLPEVYDRNKSYYRKQGFIRANSREDAIQSYEDWIKGTDHLEILPEKRAEILKALESGELKGKTLKYFEPNAEDSHAVRLAKLVTEQSKPITEQSKPIIEKTTKTVSLPGDIPLGSAYKVRNADRDFFIENPSNDMAVNIITPKKGGSFEEFMEAARQQELLKTLRGTKGMTADDIMDTYPNIRLEKDITVRDIHGNKVEISEGEKLTPYELKGNKILLQDGETYLVNKNKYQNIKGNSEIAEGKPFAPELEELEEVVSPAGESLGWMNYNDPNVGVLHGGENYREILIKMPERKPAVVWESDDSLIGKTSDGPTYTITTDEIELTEGLVRPEVWVKYSIHSSDGKYHTSHFFNKADNNNLLQVKEIIEDVELSRTGSPRDFPSEHFPNQKNIVTTLRVNDRTYKGEKVLFGEEFQSDWARELRGMIKEYGSDIGKKKFIEKYGEASHKAVSSSMELAIESFLKRAVDGNYDRIAWISGEQTKVRYNLQLRDITYAKKVGDKVEVTARGRKKILTTPEEKELYKLLGDKSKDIKKGIDLSENPLRLEAKWAYNLYDKEIKSLVKKLTGQEVEVFDMELPTEQWAINAGQPNVKVLTREDLEVGLEATLNSRRIDLRGKYIITDVLKDGKFKAVNKRYYDVMKTIDHLNDKQFDEAISKSKETFDLSRQSLKGDLGQQGIKLTPEVKNKVRGMAAEIETSGKMFEDKTDEFRKVWEDSRKRGIINLSGFYTPRALQTMPLEDVHGITHTMDDLVFSAVNTPLEDLAKTGKLDPLTNLLYEGRENIAKISEYGPNMAKKVRDLAKGQSVPVTNNTGIIMKMVGHGLTNKAIKEKGLKGAIEEVLRKASISEEAIKEVTKPGFLRRIIGKESKVMEVLKDGIPSNMVKLGKDIRKHYDDMRKEVNIVRKAMDKEEIPYRENFSEVVQETSLWDKLIGHQYTKTADNIDFINTNPRKNPHALIRNAQAKDIEWNLWKSLPRYHNAIAKDMYMAPLVEQWRAFNKVLKKRAGPLALPKLTRQLDQHIKENLVGRTPVLDAFINLDPESNSSKIWQSIIRARNTAVLSGNVIWTTFIQPASVVLAGARVTAGGKYPVFGVFRGPYNLAKGLIRWNTKEGRAEVMRLPTTRTKAAGKSIGSTGAGDLDRTAKSLVRSKWDTLDGFMVKYADWMEYHTTGVSAAAGYEMAETLSMNRKQADFVADWVAGATQSRYNREARTLIQNNTIFRANIPFQTYLFELYRFNKTLVGAKGGIPLKKKERINQTIALIGGMYLYDKYYLEPLTGRSLLRPSTFFPVIGEGVEYMLQEGFAAVGTNPDTPFLGEFLKMRERGAAAGTRGYPAGGATYQDVLSFFNGVRKYTEHGNINPLRKALTKTVMGFTGVGGASTLNRFIDGMIANGKGYMSDSAGRRLFTIKGIDRVLSPFIGPYSTPSGLEFFEDGGSIIERDAYDERERLNGLDREEADKEFEIIMTNNPEQGRKMLKIDADMKYPNLAKLRGLNDVDTAWMIANIFEEENGSPEWEANEIDIYTKYGEFDKTIFDHLEVLNKAKEEGMHGRNPIEVLLGKEINEQGLLETIGLYSKAILVDPLTAADRIFAGDRITRVDRGTLVVEPRLEEAKEIIEERTNAEDLRRLYFNYRVPTELGGSVRPEDLIAFHRSEMEANEMMRDLLIDHFRAGTISVEKARELLLGFQNSEIPPEDIIREYPPIGEGEGKIASEEFLNKIFEKVDELDRAFEVSIPGPNPPSKPYFMRMDENLDKELQDIIMEKEEGIDIDLKNKDRDIDIDLNKDRGIDIDLKKDKGIDIDLKKDKGIDIKLKK